MRGGHVSFEADEWDVIEWTFPANLHLTGVFIAWENWQPGDYGYTGLANPAVMCNPTVQADAGQDIIEVPAGLRPYFDPTVIGSDIYVEIWTTKPGPLKERVKVVSVDANGLHLSKNLEYTHATSVVLIPLYGLYHPLEGDDGTEGGLYLCGSGNAILGSITRAEATKKLDANLCLCVRVKATSAVATRSLCANFLTFLNA
jgi:hypothetical protein